MDAGSNPASAQEPSGTGPLRSLGGSTAAALRSSSAEPDFEDVFRIRICDPVFFCARMQATFDTQVWLFDEFGRGILGNDDGNGNQAVIFPPANDGTQARIHTPGVYLVAVSGFDNDPIGQGPLPGGSGPIFLQETRTERSGPDGPGGGSPLTFWTGGAATQTGEYIIRLEGAAFVEDDCTSTGYVQRPCIPTVGEWGVAVIFLCLLVGGVLVLGRRGAGPSETSHLRG
jgi:hypothetical protein